MDNTDQLTPLGKAVYWAKRAEKCVEDHSFSLDQYTDRVRLYMDLSRMWLRIDAETPEHRSTSVQELLTTERVIEDVRPNV